MYVVNDALINWGGLSDGSDLVAEEIGWFGQGWNSPSYTRSNLEAIDIEKSFADSPVASQTKGSWSSTSGKDSSDGRGGRLVIGRSRVKIPVREGFFFNREKLFSRWIDDLSNHAETCIRYTLIIWVIKICNGFGQYNIADRPG